MRQVLEIENTYTIGICKALYFYLAGKYIQTYFLHLSNLQIDNMGGVGSILLAMTKLKCNLQVSTVKSGQGYNRNGN